MAYLPWNLVSGLRLYPSRGKPQGPGKAACKYPDRVDADRILARSGLELHSVGAYFRVEKLWLLTLLEKSRFLSHAYTLFFVMISFVIFNGESLEQAFSDLAGLAGAGGIPLVSAEALYYLRSFAVVLVTGVIGAAPAVRSLAGKIAQKPAGGRLLNLLEPVALAGLLLVMTAYLVDGSFNPFLYFRF